MGSWRLVKFGGAESAQRRQQSLRVVIDGANAVVAEKRGKNPFQNFAVGEHVRDAAGDAKIVFEHGETAIGKAHEIGAADADIYSTRDIETAHLAAEVAA